MNYKRLTIATLIIFVLAQIWGFLTCGWLFNWIYEIEPTSVWLEMERMSLPLGLLWGFIFSLTFVFAYATFYAGIPGNGIKKGIRFGLLIWLVGAFPGMGSMSVYTVIAHQVIIYWVINALIQLIWQGAIVGRVYEPNSLAKVGE
uniref:Uncharacterized protein n=1 Tax=Candidatus Kentrum sp. TC TaxID=2126339 RepID=A0A450YFV3_9GAMM|nr:MAG: hypothetical protein BECKTC1821E_GA0114239_100740 [Candidatus Kentron sp. TC]VFK41908.1 MAG: hypothetical protein BECKTC1821D_GA0114238_101137 [Candidatus Kentron sp. TC]VFK57671.1 MAG: hypothetical protein BECKTC1821F_GA0114240_101918 [Candidatus Kentron sp. TC]